MTSGPARLEREDRHGFQVWDRQLCPMPTPHVHEQVEVLVLERGWLDHWQCGERCRFGPGTLLAFWAAFPHRTVACSPDAACTLLYLPLEWFLGHPLGAGLTARWLGRGILVDEDPAHVPWAREQLAAFVDRDPTARGLSRLEIELYLLRVAQRRGLLAGGGERGAAGQEAQRRAASAMIDAILRRYAEPLTVADIAAVAGLNARYAMGMFKRVVGLGIWEFVLQVRTAHAQRLLADPDTSVLDAALAAGFGSTARFYATFRRITGATPDKYRRELAG
jgi:AraC-like DNA-binding protein